MTKHESPPFRMRVEGDRLVPASAWDQERLATYRRGSTLNVVITQEKNRKLERKYWAILSAVIAKCPVKQRTTEDLHRAIRLKLGVVDAFFTFDGRLRVDVKSTTTMQDPEYQRYFDDAMALLHEITGVDPLTLGAEAADVGQDEDEHEPSAPIADEAAAGTAHTPAPAAAPPSEEAAKADTPADEGMPVADATWLLSVARQLWAATGKGEQVLVSSIAADLKKNTPENIGKAARERAQAVVKRCKTVCFGEVEPAEALEIVAGIVGVEPKEIAA